MDSISATAYLPVGKLLGSGMEQSGIPKQRRTDRPAVHKVNTYTVFRESDILYPFISGQKNLKTCIFYSNNLILISLATCFIRLSR
jgi:hypothetical protein